MIKTVGKKALLLSVITSTSLMAGAYSIPENSVNSVALSSAYVANTSGADSAYFNPANMMFEEDKHLLEAGVTYIGLSETNFQGSVDGSSNANINAQSESFVVPSIHYVSPKLGYARVGFSVVVPGGLSKRWEAQPAKKYANEFTLQVVELNPSVAMEITPEVSVAAGLRAVHSSGIVKSASTASRDMQGQSWDFGYNLALAYRPTSEIKLGLIYRSNVDLTEEGSAKLYFPDDGNYGGNKVYDGDATVSVPLPALLSLGASYTFSSNTTVELAYNRNFWSAYKELDFNYASSIGALTPAFDNPVAKDWEDTNTYRIGITQAYKSATFMLGYAYDESPVPEKTLSFELPDSNAMLFSLGGRYVINEAWDIGLAALYDMKEDRTVSASDNATDIDGVFSNSSAYLITAGVGFKF